MKDMVVANWGVGAIVREQPVKLNTPDQISGVFNSVRVLIYSSFCDDFFLIFFYACASQFYDAFFFYHKA